MSFRADLQDNIHRLELLAPSDFLRFPRESARAVNFALLGGELDVRAAFVAFNELGRYAER
ncbi:MAG TPA: hypothetical protein VFQ03_09485, partial [Candidatus Binatia bacterium]|nr:hypothetical protein [Candidatus Binatia bacterium]